MLIGVLVNLQVCRSLSAYDVFLSTNLVAWKTKKQSTISKSFVEAEYISMSATPSEIVWIHGLLEDLTVLIPLPITIYYDNCSTKHLTQNPKFHEKAKHFKRDMNYIREQVEAGFFTTTHVKSTNQLPDLFTKPCLLHDIILCVSNLALFQKSSLKE